MSDQQLIQILCFVKEKSKVKGWTIEDIEIIYKN